MCRGCAYGLVVLDRDFGKRFRQLAKETAAGIGRTVPYSVESITVYVSPYDEQALVRWLTGIAIVSGMAGVICLLASGDWRLIINPERKVPGSNG